ncbi:chromate efflux transporter [Echinimonas agarilytica]|uniref:Chromate efflux transporter n=1 Tax=Echinimonas agarilytica TaxID=1215918 RepID=A0AA41W4D1_9GAMM|nr:chromate efflux transporter [Echinimonas agarilytica]MCM2678483.1 chromate efflux transporter [Echinimonas agarilytica]
MWQIFKNFFSLGWVSFGGPAAHLGYFQRHFVTKLGWLDQARYAQLVALSQFLPGPGSSQVGFAIGYQRAGLLGGLTAFIAFTLPSFAIMVAIAALNVGLTDNAWYQGVIHGLKLFAVVVVADAVLTMAGQFWKQRFGLIVGTTTAVIMLVSPGIETQLLVLVAAALVGFQQPVSSSVESTTASASPQWWALILFTVLFIGLPWISDSNHWLGIFGEFYQAGSLVFGGGHVVLPLLQEGLADQVTSDTFLLGYASAQAVPGPMFTIATFLGYELGADLPIVGALVATLAIFLPGFLLMIGLIHYWQALASRPRLAGTIAAVNAAVVGLLLSAWYAPVFVSSVFEAQDFAVAIIGFVLLRQLKVSVLWLVPGFALLGAAVG